MQLLSLLFYIFIIYFFYTWYKKLKFINKNQLSGPFPLPIVGTILCGLPFIDLHKQSKRYGGIFRIWAGDSYVVILNDISIIREIFITNSDNFIDRPSFPSMKYLSNYHGLVTSSGEHWKLSKDIVSKSLLKIHLKQLYELVESKIDQDMKLYIEYSKSGTAFDPNPHFINYTTSTMFKYIFNEDISSLEEYNDPIIQKDIIKPTKEFFDKFSAIKVGDVINILKPIYEFQLKFETCGPNMFNFLNKKLDQHISSLSSHETPRDLMDILIKEYGIENRHSILSTCKDLMLGGIDTTATGFYHIVLLSCVYKDIQDKVYDELRSVIKNRDRVNLSDKSNLPYTNAFIKECIRFLPISGFPIPRLSKEDILINNQYFIPKNSQILINFYSLFNNEKYFEDPQTFNPSRFLDPNSISNQAFIPFTIGIRSCIAKQFASDQLFLYISNLLLNFKINNMNNINYSINNFKYGLTLKFKDNLNIYLTKR